MGKIHIDRAINKAFLFGYKLATQQAAKWIEEYLANDNRIDDWLRDSKAIKSGKQKFFEFMGGIKNEKGNTATSL